MILVHVVKHKLRENLVTWHKFTGAVFRKRHSISLFSLDCSQWYRDGTNEQMITIFISLLHKLRLEIEFGKSFEINSVREWKLREGGLYDWLSRAIFRSHSDTLGIMCFIVMLYVSLRTWTNWWKWVKNSFKSQRADCLTANTVKMTVYLHWMGWHRLVSSHFGAIPSLHITY